MKEENNKEKENVEVKKGNKIVVRLLILFIAGLITANFILSEPKYEITLSIITCLALLVILALSDVFDNLSIPQVISLSKNIKEVKKENEGLKETNQKLIEQVVNIKNTNNQKVFVQLYGSKNIEDIGKSAEEEKLPELENTSSRRMRRIVEKDNNIESSIRYRKYIQMLLLKKALASNNYEENIRDIKYDVELVTMNNEIINNKETVNFDALSVTKERNIFYEVKTNFIINEMTVNRIITMLNSLDSYVEVNKTSCELVLVIPKYDDKLEKTISSESNNDYISFKDALNKILISRSIFKNTTPLEIKEIPITKKELDAYIKERENN